MMITAAIILLAIVAPNIASPIPTLNTARSISRPRSNDGTPRAVGVFTRTTRGGTKKRNIAMKRAAETAIAVRKTAIVPVTSKPVVVPGKLERISANKRRSSDDEDEEDDDEGGDDEQDDEGDGEEGDDEEGDDEEEGDDDEDDDEEEDDEEGDEEEDDEEGDGAEDDEGGDDEEDDGEDEEGGDEDDGEDDGEGDGEDDDAEDDGEDDGGDDGEDDDEDGGEMEDDSVVEVRDANKQATGKRGIPTGRGVSAFNHRKRYVIDELD